jgi:hypothetical protein
MIATSDGITEIVSAGIHVVTSISKVLALSGSHVTAIKCASVHIITVNWCGNAQSIENVTFVEVAGNWGANNWSGVQAMRAILRSVLASSLQIATS